jgi:hypothetical protein
MSPLRAGKEIALRFQPRRYDGRSVGNFMSRRIMQWLWLGATALSWLLCFTRHGPGAMAFWLVLGLIGAIGTALAFVQVRIEANAQPDPMIEIMRERRGNKPPQE